MHIFKWFWKWVTWVFLSPSLGTNTPTLPKRMMTPFLVHMLWLLLTNCPPSGSMTQASSLGISCWKWSWLMPPYIDPYDSGKKKRTLELSVTLNCHSDSKHIKLNQLKSLKRCNSHTVFLPYHFATFDHHLKSWGYQHLLALQEETLRSDMLLVSESHGQRLPLSSLEFIMGAVLTE